MGRGGPENEDYKLLRREKGSNVNHFGLAYRYGYTWPRDIPAQETRVTTRTKISLFFFLSHESPRSQA